MTLEYTVIAGLKWMIDRGDACAWERLLSLNIQRLVWDAWNIEHIARRGIAPEDVEWLMGNAEPGPLFKHSRSGTVAAFGKDCRDRYLMVILAIKSEGVYYVVTARNMSAKEKRYFKSRSK